MHFFLVVVGPCGCSVARLLVVNTDPNKVLYEISLGSAETDRIFMKNSYSETCFNGLKYVSFK